MPNRNPVYDEWGQPHNALTGNPLYENSAPQKSAGESLHDIAMSVPNMLIEPVRALNRLSEHGGFPNPSDPQNKQDMSALVMSMFGGNALAPARAGEAVAARALSDAGKPSLMGSALAGAENHLPMDLADYGRAAYLEARHPFEKTTIPPVLADSFGELARLEQKARNGRQTVGASDHLIDKLSEWERTGGSPFNDEGAGINPYEATALNAQIRQNKVRTGTLFSDTGKPSLMGSALAGAERQPGFDVWHGSPHDFDKFSLDKIGSGEGAQAYGHGLYTAENRKVAEGYRDALNGQAVNPDRNARLSALSQEMEKYQIPGSYRKYNDPRGAELAAEYDRIMQERADDKGYLYQARINANPEHFLDWDKPLSEQSEAVQSAVKNDPLWTAPLNESPDNLMRNLLRDPTFSGQLREAGVPGVKYLDQGSRGTGQGSHNYVVFDDSLIDTLHKWRGDEQLYSGGAPAVGAMAGANQNQPTTADLLAILEKHGVKF